MDRITDLNKLIYAEVKLFCDKISVFQKNLNRNTKWEIRLEGQIKKLLQQMKMLRKEKNKRGYVKRKRPKENAKSDHLKK